MSQSDRVFNPPPGWPAPPEGWVPPTGWTPDPAWPDPPEGWELWLPGEPVEEPHVDQSSGKTAETTWSAAVAEEPALSKANSNDPIVDSEYVELSDDQVLQNVGIYRYHHPLENAEAYKIRLKALGAQMVDIVRSGHAIEASNLFTFDNSLSKGRRMTSDLSKLMLRAYNAESDNVIRTLKVGNFATAKQRLEASRKAIAKLGSMMSMHISDEFHALRLEEIELTADWLMRKQEEKEAASEERARLREERRVAKELAEERSRLDKERAHILNALQKLADAGEADEELESRLKLLDDSIAQNDYRAANIRAGYVYVISNQGSFGDNIVKIGLTRRLEPLDRINELGGASVPFRFDVHALYFSEDAVELETQLHHYFSHKAVNMANSRKEFFFATPSEVRDVLTEKVGNLLEFTEHADATEYFQSRHHWKPQFRTGNQGVQRS